MLTESHTHWDIFCRGHADQALCGYVAQSNQWQHGYHLPGVWLHQHTFLTAEQNHQRQVSQTWHTEIWHNSNNLFYQLKNKKKFNKLKLKRPTDHISAAASLCGN